MSTCNCRNLLDAHVLIWAADNVLLLSPQARELLETTDDALYVSTGTVWEISLKVGLGKLHLSMSYEGWMAKVLADLGSEVLPITIADAAVQAELPLHHRDPFDRILVAQCLTSKLQLVSSDEIFDNYGITRIW